MPNTSAETGTDMRERQQPEQEKDSVRQAQRTVGPDADADRSDATAFAPGGPSAAMILRLQRSVGNAAVAHMMALQRRSAVRDVLDEPGQPLAEPTRKDMEARLGADFSQVRLHTDSAARQSADELGARAYTSGHHIVVGADGIDQHTLAHELTHVVQQRSGPVAGTDRGDGLRVSDPTDRFEREAEATAREVMAKPVGDSGQTPDERAGTTASASDATAQRVTLDHSEAPVQRSIGLHANRAGNPEFQYDNVRPAWTGRAAALAATAAAGTSAFGGARNLNHIISFERIQRDLVKHLNDLLRFRSRQQGWQPAVDALNATCDALFAATGTAAHRDMVRLRTFLVNTIRTLPVQPTQLQSRMATIAAGNLLSALNSSVDNLRPGDASLNQSIGSSIDADFRPGTVWYSGPVVSEGTPPAPGNPPANATILAGPPGPAPAGTIQVTNIECLRLTAAHESKVFAYARSTRSEIRFVVNGLGGVLHPAAANGQQLSSTQLPTVAPAAGAAPYPVLVMDPNNARAPFLYR